MTMKSLQLTYFIMLFMLFDAQCQTQEIDLWPDGVPNSKNSNDYIENQLFKDSLIQKIYNVTNPTLTLFKPENPNGLSIIICPGGGYSYLTMNKEGFKVAAWLNTLGITAFVLKSRLPSDSIMIDKSIGSVQDAQRAIRYVRANSEELELNPKKIGIMGFSAGGHLAASVSTLYAEEFYKPLENVSARPDFSILIYPVISMEDGITHKGSRMNLLGEIVSDEMKQKFSLEKQVNSLTPPTFLVHASDDRSVPIENSINYFNELKKHEVSVEMHVYPNGGHGFGLGSLGTTKHWRESCEYWLEFIFE